MLKLIPPELILITLILVILPSILAGLIRYKLYNHLTDSANKITRLLSPETSHGKQPPIVETLKRRYKEASQHLEKVNTVALIDGIYTQEKFTFFNFSLRCEQWDYFCQVLPNLLLAFGLLGTFFGITGNLYNLSQTIDRAEGDISNLVAQLQTPLQNMGIAFITSLAALLFSSALTVINLRWNTNLAKSLLIHSLEDYLDNIFQSTIEGKTRLDKAIDRMVKQQEEFLSRFHENIGRVLETSIGNAANKMVTANQSFQNNVDSLVSRFQDVSGSLAASTNNFQGSTSLLKEQVKTISEVVTVFKKSSDRIETSTASFQKASEKIEASKFSENLENLTRDLATTQKSFSQSTEFLGNQVTKISESHQQAVQLAEQVYTQLQQASEKLQYSAMGFVEASQTIQQSNFADKLSTATKELAVIPSQFQESTAILHESIPSLNKAIAAINKSANKNINLVEQVNSLNQYSTQILESSDKRIELETASFDRIQSELNNLVTTLNKHQEQTNLAMTNFGGKLLTSFEQKTDTHTHNLKIVGQNLEQYLGNLGEIKGQITNLVSTFTEYSTKSFAYGERRIELEKNSFEGIQSELNNLISQFKQNGQQVNANLNGIGMTSDRLLKSFEQQTNNNTGQFQQLLNNLEQFLTQLNQTNSEFAQLGSILKQNNKQGNSGLNNLGDDINNLGNDLNNFFKKPR
jgi:methyl-accepting chemotaxis protein